MVNTLYHGDSKEILGDIKQNSINLIYMDPPFFTNRAFVTDSISQDNVTFEDIWKNGITEYLNFMKVIFNESIRILRDDGLLFLHCDWHSVHYLKIELDKIFGYHNFVNEIIWKRHNSQNNSKQGAKIFGRIHDTILVYGKTKNHVWNQLYQQYSEEYLDKTYNRIDENGQRYALGDLSGPGGKAKGNPYFEFMGYKRYWRYNKTKMHQLYQEKKIIQTKKGTVPKLKRYLKDMKGIPLSDVWTDIGNEQTTNRKQILYPTQKPLSLLKRIVLSSSNENDTVLDPFCGSGTTLIAANKLKRKWIGIEKNDDAIEIINNRLIKNNIHNFKKFSVCNNIVNS